MNEKNKTKQPDKEPFKLYKKTPVKNNKLENILKSCGKIGGTIMGDGKNLKLKIKNKDVMSDHVYRTIVACLRILQHVKKTRNEDREKEEHR